MNGWVCGQTHGFPDGRVDGWMRMDGWKDECLGFCSRAQSGLATILLNIYIYILFAVLVDVGMKRISLY